MTDKELADLVRLTRLVDRAEGDRAVLLGAFLDLADMAHGDAGGDVMLRWRERGQQAMDAGPVMAPQSHRAATAFPGAVTGPRNVRLPDREPETEIVRVASVLPGATIYQDPPKYPPAPVRRMVFKPKGN